MNPQQVKKLRQLSLLASATIASILPYDQLKISLQLEDDQSLEEFVIDSIYSELIAARLNPAKRLVEVTLVAPVRDVPAAEIKNMVTGLERWEARARMTLSMIENREVGTRAQAAADWARVNKLNQLMGAQAGVGEDGDEIQSPQKPRVRSKEDDAAATLSDLASSSGIWSQSEAMELDSGDIHEMEG